MAGKERGRSSEKIVSSHVPPASIPSPTSPGRTHLRLALDLRRLVRVTRANIECEQEAPALVIPLVGLECHLKIEKLVFALREAAHDFQSFAKVATAIRRQRAEVCVVAPCVSRGATARCASYKECFFVLSVRSGEDIVLDTHRFGEVEFRYVLLQTQLAGSQLP